MSENEKTLWSNALFRWLVYLPVGWGIAFVAVTIPYEIWNWKWLEFAYPKDSVGNLHLSQDLGLHPKFISQVLSLRVLCHVMSLSIGGGFCCARHVVLFASGCRSSAQEVRWRGQCHLACYFQGGEVATCDPVSCCGMPK